MDLIVENALFYEIKNIKGVSNGFKKNPLDAPFLLDLN